MTYHDLIQLYFERSNALQSYWTLYVVVIGGLLAFSSIRKERPGYAKLLRQPPRGIEQPATHPTFL
jgi:hypothetical protein